MAAKAKRAQVLQIALSSPFHYGHDMIRIPECLTRKPLQPPSLKEFFPLCPARAQECAAGRYGVGPAYSAYPGVAQQNLLAKVAGVSAEAPLVYAPI
jgi:hypothetical protein